MDFIHSYLKKLNLNDLYFEQKVIKVVQSVSSIPWGEGRSIEDVFLKGVGTCTGKHKVLQACFDELGIKYELVVCTFKWGEQGIKYPEKLQKILDEGEWEHGHNFLKLMNGDYIDVTWDPFLESIGFKVLPKDWKLGQSFIGVQNIIQQWDNVSIDDKKFQLIDSLSPELKERRNRFLIEFIKWIKDFRLDIK